MGSYMVHLLHGPTLTWFTSYRVNLTMCPMHALMRQKGDNVTEVHFARVKRALDRVR